MKQLRNNLFTFSLCLLIVFMLSCKQGVEVDNKETLSVPTGFEVIKTTARTVTLAWNPVDKADLYRLYFPETTNADDFLCVVIDEPESMYWNATKENGKINFTLDKRFIKPNTTYYFSIQASTKDWRTDNLIDSSKSSEIVVKTNELDNLEIPSNFKFSNINKGRVTLNWDPVGDADYYYLYISTSGILSELTQETPYKYYDTTANISLNYDYTQYYFVLYAVSDSIQSEPTEILTMGTDLIPLNSPGNFNIQKYTSKSVTLSWNSVSGASAYKVYFGTSRDSLEYTVSTDKTFYTKMGLSPSTIYYFAIEAYNSSRDGYLTEILSQTTEVAGITEETEIPDSIIGMTFSVGDTAKYSFTDSSNCTLENFTMSSGYQWYSYPTYTYTKTSDSEATLVVDYTYYNYRIISYEYYYYIYSYNTMTYYLTFNSSSEGTYSQSYYNKVRTINQDGTDDDVFSRTLNGSFTLE